LCSKNGLGQIWLRGIIKPGTLSFGTDVIQQLPTDFQSANAYNSPLEAWLDSGECQAGLTFMYEGKIKVYLPLAGSAKTQNFHINKVIKIA